MVSALCDYTCYLLEAEALRSSAPRTQSKCILTHFAFGVLCVIVVCAYAALFPPWLRLGTGAAVLLSVLFRLELLSERAGRQLLLRLSQQISIVLRVLRLRAMDYGSTYLVAIDSTCLVAVGAAVLDSGSII